MGDAAVQGWPHRGQQCGDRVCGLAGGLVVEKWDSMEREHGPQA